MEANKGNESIPKKRGRKPRYIHKCSEKETLARMSEILIGNGKPEAGLAFRFSEFMADHKRVVDDISEIKGKVTEAIESSGKAVHAVETYRAELNGIEIGEGKKTAKTKLKFDTVVSIIGTVVIVIGLIITMITLRKDNDQTDQKIDNLGNSGVTRAGVDAKKWTTFQRDSIINEDQKVREMLIERNKKK